MTGVRALFSYRNIVDELASLRNPRTLALGIVSGYAVTSCFAVLLGVAVASGVLRWHWAFGALVAAKLVTNTIALVALRMDRWALALGGLNVAMDAVVMTGAIWATGDSASPLVAIYVIEVSVLALLTNLSITMLIGALCLVLYIVMSIVVAAGVLPHFPTPAEWGGDRGAYLALAFAFTTFVIAAPTFYTSLILRRLKSNERRLEARTIALIDAGKQKAQFMANVTHELRTPLQGIIGLSDLVTKGIYGEATERQRHAMHNVKDSAKRLLALIDDLLQLASADAGKLELKVAEVDLTELLPGSVATAQWLLAGKALDVRLDVEPSLPPVITDRAKLNQVVLNLMSNAIKFTPDGGSIVLRARRAGAAVKLEVEDTGVGIPARELDRVFDEFHQVDGSMSREYGGVGLGLALVRRMLVLLGGTISVRSEVGRGSTFTVHLPLTPPAEAIAETSAA
jgi:signal transduction histidine kinase